MNMTPHTGIDAEHPLLHRWNESIGPLSPYMGERFDEYFIVLGRNRDSRSLTESNFHVACEMLSDKIPVFKEGAIVDIPPEERLLPGVIIARFNHWACGWVEYLLVHESCNSALEIASDIQHSLEEYPILNEDDFSNRVCKVTDPIIDDIFNEISDEIDEIRHENRLLYSDIVRGGRYVQGNFEKMKLYSRRYPEIRLTVDEDCLRDRICTYSDRFGSDEYE